MKLTDALARSSGVITEESERRAFTVHDIESGNLSQLRTPRGTYLFAYKRISYERNENTPRECSLSITRTSYCGKRMERVSSLMCDPEAIALWINERKKAILNRDFNERKYMLPHYEI